MSYEEERSIKENLLDQVKKDGNHLEPIATYCIENLINTPENREKLLKKPLKECFEYLEKEAMKVAVDAPKIGSANRAMVAKIHQDEVFGWVREFYEISDLTVVKQPEAEKSKTVSIFDYM
jgi:hypothetical protein